jgi:hypothetical protein
MLSVRKDGKGLQAGDKYCNILKHMLQLGFNWMISPKARAFFLDIRRVFARRFTPS